VKWAWASAEGVQTNSQANVFHIEQL